MNGPRLDSFPEELFSLSGRSSPQHATLFWTRVIALNSPMNTKPEDLLTRIHVPLRD